MAAKMTPAEKVARNLALWFLTHGRYVSAPSLKGSAAMGFLPAAAREPDLDEQFAEGGFAGLSVQAVGHEVGVSEPKVHVYVSRASRLALRAIPTSAGDVPIEANRMGKLLVRPEDSLGATPQGVIYERHGRIACGSSCAPAGESYAGTVGAIVRKKSRDDLYLLSNNHIFAAGNHTPVGMPVMAPSMLDAGANRRAPTEVARHAAIVPLRSGEPTQVEPCKEDVALARVVDPGRVSSWQGTEQDGYDTPTEIADLKSGDEVKKFGRTTGLTTGSVESLVKSPTPLSYRLKLFTAQVYFQDFWTVVGDQGEPFALQGDSGSLVVTADGKAAAGLIFACDDRYALILPMTHVVKCFGGLTLVDGHGV
jgi:hypothetical protein